MVVDTARTALLARCPRCGQGKLFDGYLQLGKQCAHCGLDYAMFDAGDGPAVFVILVVGAIVCGGALFVEFTYQPPYWVHAALWIPVTTVLTFALLRLAKSLLLVLQYKHKAGEGRAAN
ncbi:MAG: DUF983 domain-containing protein [Alphaproteobacteria bacterium]|nr:DUF983 domain-containing protein [Alphaproteobacteria bacterium]